MPPLKRPAGAVAALAFAWRTIAADPVRLLGLAAVALLVDVGATLALVTAIVHARPWSILLVILGVRCAAVGAVRAGLLVLGASVRGRRGRLVAIPVAIVLELVGGAAIAAVVAVALVPFGGLGALIAAQGLFPVALVAGAIGLVAGWLASVVVRAALAPLLPRFVLGRPATPSPLGFALRVVLLGDLVRVLGAFALAIGALPAYPLPLLAWLAPHEPEARTHRRSAA